MDIEVTGRTEGRAQTYQKSHDLIHTNTSKSLPDRLVGAVSFNVEVLSNGAMPEEGILSDDAARKDKRETRQLEDLRGSEKSKDDATDLIESRSCSSGTDDVSTPSMRIFPVTRWLSMALKSARRVVDFPDPVL